MPEAQPVVVELNEGSTVIFDVTDTTADDEEQPTPLIIQAFGG